MFKSISAALVLLVVQTSSVLAVTPFSVYPTEAQYIKYETELEQFFSTLATKDAGEYIRISDSQRRFDGKVLCSMLTAFSTEEYLTSELERHRLLYDAQELRNKNAYTLGVAAAAIDTICTEHRASLIDFVQKYQPNFNSK